MLLNPFKNLVVEFMNMFVHMCIAMSSAGSFEGNIEGSRFDSSTLVPTFYILLGLPLETVFFLYKGTFFGLSLILF